MLIQDTKELLKTHDQQQPSERQAERPAQHAIHHGEFSRETLWGETHDWLSVCSSVQRLYSYDGEQFQYILLFSSFISTLVLNRPLTLTLSTDNYLKHFFSASFSFHSFAYLPPPPSLLLRPSLFHFVSIFFVTLPSFQSSMNIRTSLIVLIRNCTNHAQ